MPNFEIRPPRLEALRQRLTHLSEEEADAAETRLWHYTEIVRRIFLRRFLDTDAEDESSRRPDSTNSDLDSRVGPS